MSTRETRLKKELLGMEELHQQSSFIDFVTNADPPDEYTVTFTCLGMVDPSRIGDKHIVRIYLHAEFPYFPPKVSFLTPSFHPNIAAPLQMSSVQEELEYALRRAPNEETRRRIREDALNNKDLNTARACLDTLDYNWSPAITLPQICLELAEMIQFKRYNAGHALNWEAARWARNHQDQLPVDVRTVLDLKALSSIRILSETMASEIEILILEEEAHA